MKLPWLWPLFGPKTKHVHLILKSLSAHNWFAIAKVLLSLFAFKRGLVALDQQIIVILFANKDLIL